MAGSIACTIGYNVPLPSSGDNNSNNNSPESNYPQNPVSNPSNNLPDVLPYELIPDTISSLTCSNTQMVGNKPFALNVISYLQLSQKFKERHNINSRTPNQKTLQLIENSAFKRAYAQWALHNESNLAASIVKSNQTEQLIRDYFPPFDNRSTSELLSQLKTVYTTRSTNRRDVQNSGDFRASLPISGQQFLNIIPDLAGSRAGNLLVTLTYTFRGEKLIYSPERLPYGRSYKISFEDPYRGNYLTGIQEENLSARKTTRTSWSCPENLRFMVHRSTTAETNPFNRAKEQYKDFPTYNNLLKEGYCHTKNYRAPRNIANYFNKEFGTSRLEQLPFELGTTIVFRKDRNVEVVDTGQPCIKFRRSQCYNPDGVYRVEFDPEKIRDCLRIQDINYRQADNEEFYRICPAFLSVCYRR